MYEQSSLSRSAIVYIIHTYIHTHTRRVYNSIYEQSRLSRSSFACPFTSSNKIMDWVNGSIAEVDGPISGVVSSIFVILGGPRIPGERGIILDIESVNLRSDAEFVEIRGILCV